MAAGELEKKDEAAGSSKSADKKRQASEDEAAGPSKHTDKEAVAYFESRKETKRVKDIRIVGGYLRIYTDLPDSASNSKQAIKLCEAGRDYLVGELGKPNPVVFVQAEFGENGNPVLANILGPDDSDCRVTIPSRGNSGGPDRGGRTDRRRATRAGVPKRERRAPWDSCSGGSDHRGRSVHPNSGLAADRAALGDHPADGLDDLPSVAEMRGRLLEGLTDGTITLRR